MGFIDRTATILEAKINKLLGKAEDPRETLDASYEKQVDLLRNVKKGIAELTTAKKSLEQQKQKLCASIFDIEDQAKDLLRQGNEELAKTALERKVTTEEQISGLTKQIKEMAVSQNKLVETGKTLELKIEQFKSKKETMKAQYSAAEAQVKITESLGGIGSQIGNAGDAMRRAEDRTQTMTARASAVEELTDSGVLSDGLDNTSSLDRELSKARNKNRVDEEFERMKTNMNQRK